LQTGAGQNGDAEYDRPRRKHENLEGRRRGRRSAVGGDGEYGVAADTALVQVVKHGGRLRSLTGGASTRGAPLRDGRKFSGRVDFGDAPSAQVRKAPKAGAHVSTGVVENTMSATFTHTPDTSAKVRVMAALINWRSSRPARTYRIATVVLGLLSLVSPLAAAGTDNATKFTLICAHLVAAAVVIPMVSRCLAGTRGPGHNSQHATRTPPAQH
jgi:hypothetical protein